jgi:hypothetical protein
MIRSIAVAALFVSLAMASAVCAQDELVGTWELVIDPEEEVEGRESLTLEADHTFRIVVEAEFGPEFLNGGFGGDGDVGSFDIAECRRVTESVVAESSWGQAKAATLR